MSRRSVIRIVAWIAFPALLACSDDTVLPTPDLGGKKEATVESDALPPDTGWTGRPDLTPGICDPVCIAQNFSLCVKDPSDNQCVECLKDGDCTGNPGALGTQCDTQNKFCICVDDNDCVGNMRGNKCDTANQMCVCATDADCKGWVCVGGTVKTCRPPCKVDSDCDPTAPKCDTTTGRCIACKVDSDCTSTTNKYCLAGKCVPCKSDSDCSAPTPFCDAAVGRPRGGGAPFPWHPAAISSSTARIGSTARRAASTCENMGKTDMRRLLFKLPGEL